MKLSVSCVIRVIICLMGVHNCIIHTMTVERLIASKIARYIHHRYFNRIRDDMPTKEIIKQVGYILDDSTLKAPVSVFVKEALVPLLSEKIFKMYTDASAIDRRNSKILTCKFFDGTTETVEQDARTRERIVLRPKETSPWNKLSLADLIKVFRLVQNFKKLGFSYPDFSVL